MQPKDNQTPLDPVTAPVSEPAPVSAPAPELISDDEPDEAREAILEHSRHQDRIDKLERQNRVLRSKLRRKPAEAPQEPAVIAQPKPTMKSDLWSLITGE